MIAGPWGQWGPDQRPPFRVYVLSHSHSECIWGTMVTESVPNNSALPESPSHLPHTQHVKVLPGDQIGGVAQVTERAFGTSKPPEPVSWACCKSADWIYDVDGPTIVFPVEAA